MNDNDKGCYLINNVIIFDPNEYTLVNKLISKKAILKPQASLCLQLLITKQTVIVGQNELMEFAWGENHRQVSYNNFYQHILTIRKAFREPDFSPIVISTIPRQGLVIKEDVIIEKLTDNSVKSQNPLSVKPSDNSAFDFTERTPLSYSRKSFWIFLMILSCVVILALALWQNSRAQDDFFSDYVDMSSKNLSCRYYFNSNVDNYSDHKNFIDQHPEFCQKKEHVYITTFPHVRKISVFICREKFKPQGMNYCRSIFYPEYDAND